MPWIRSRKIDDDKSSCRPSVVNPEPILDRPQTSINAAIEGFVFVNVVKTIFNCVDTDKFDTLNEYEFNLGS